MNQWIAAGNRTEAVETIRTSLSPKGEALGLCGSVGRQIKEYNPNILNSVSDGGFSYNGLRYFDCISSAGTTGAYMQISETCKVAPQVYNVKFLEIVRIFVLENNSVCRNGKGTNTLQMVVDPAHQIFVNIPSDKLQKTLAAFKILNPQIELKKSF